MTLLLAAPELSRQRRSRTQSSPRQPFTDRFVTADGAPRAQVPFSGLRTLWINTGTQCNIECLNCYIKSSPTNDSLVYVTMDDALPHLDDAKAMGAEEIGFTGGEPFLNPHATDLIEAALSRKFSVLILTNAMRPMMRPRIQDNLIRLKEKYSEQLKLRVSLDHYTENGHDAERGKGAFKHAMQGIHWLLANGFNVSIAGRMGSEVTQDEAKARAAYDELFKSRDFPIDSYSKQLVLFPEMDDTETTPEITDACWSITGVKPETMMCSSSRMVVRRRGSHAATILACTLITETPEFELGRRIEDTLDPISLNHPHCSRFCVLGGASCSGG